MPASTAQPPNDRMRTDMTLAISEVATYAPPTTISTITARSLSITGPAPPDRSTATAASAWRVVVPMGAA